MRHQTRSDTQSRAKNLALLGLGVAGAYAGWRAAQTQRIALQNRTLRRGKKIVILGGGFAGVSVARELARLLPHAEDARITLVDPHGYQLFTPMLTEAAGGEIDTRHIVHTLDALSPRVTFLRARADGVELARRHVSVTLGNIEEDLPTATRQLDFDHLVIAVGSVTNDHHLPGVAEHSIGMRTLHDASAVLNRTLALLERAATEEDTQARKALLTFVVGGGGYTGVETMAALNSLVRHGARKYARIHPEDIRTVIVDPGDRLLPELKATGLARYAQKKLEEHGVEVRLNSTITDAGSDYVQLKGVERIDAHTLIWAGGVRPNPFVAVLPLPRGKHGGLVVDACCQVREHPGVWALGDCAEVPETDPRQTYAPTAQNASHEGGQVARNIVAVLRGEPPQPFVYTPVGELALVGKRSGVAEVHGLRFSGPLAWALWRLFYWIQMPDPRQRTRILLDWLLDCILGRNQIALPIRQTQGDRSGSQDAGAAVPAKASAHS